MAKLVAQLDRDGSGKIGPSDLPRMYHLELTRGSAQYQPYRRPIARLPGRIARQQPTPPPSPTGPTWFRKMDRNGDGDVSRREFLGSEEQFRRLDVDGDGLISLEEAVKADVALRKSSR
jgi:Ca2+-binding EF-hand superfamily protein